jgi:hypothetical protein
MKTPLSILLLPIMFMIGCCSADKGSLSNKVLLLKVDYTTNAFEGGKEFSFTKNPKSFTVINEYFAPGDFGSIKMKYSELDETLFYGTIVWNGQGKMQFPTDLQTPERFRSVSTEDIAFPSSGFQNVFNPNNQDYDYYRVWMSVQRLEKVRQYLKSNPTSSVKIFLYTPSVGIGDPEDWDWIIFMKN